MPPDYQTLRDEMVDTQICARGITDPAVIAAMRTVPRHLFVPPDQRAYAYYDTPLPIGCSQTISQPYIVALMTEALKLDKTSRVLEIGTGSGYQTAVLAEIADSVYSIETIPELHERAKKLLESLGYDRVHLRLGDGYYGWEEYAPFDAIIITAAPREVPKPLLDQLADGGRMVVPVGDFYQELLLLHRTGDKIRKRSLGGVIFVPMTGKAEEVEQ